MPCFYPLDGYRAKNPNENGNYGVVFSKKGAQLDAPIKLPCGKCSGCRLDLSRQWALRCMHEASMHDHNSFITLTYDEEHLPEDNSVSVVEVQNFLKRLRQEIYPNLIRFYACGEYGENQDPTVITELGRPHYHLLIFGYGFPDKEIFKKQEKGDLYTSKQLSKVWPKGHVVIGDLTFETAAYTARYTMKKINGEEAEDHYQRIDSRTGEITYIRPEFSTQSRRPGIGGDWFHKYRKDLNKGYITHKGNKVPVPKYYKDQYAKHYYEEYEPLKEKFRVMVDDLHPEKQLNRLRVKEELNARHANRNKRNTL